MGSKAVSSGPLVDAISEWDVRESAANEEASLRGLRKKVGRQSVSRVLDSFESSKLRTSFNPGGLGISLYFYIL